MFYKELLSFVLVLFIPMSKAAVPGTFFWRPRLGIDLAIPTTEPPIAAFQPNKQNIQAGIVVLVEGYDVLTSLLGLLSGIQYASEDDTMNPANGGYFTSAYRWSLRALNLFPHWMRGNFHDALAVWNNRFKYMDSEVPLWARKLVPWVPAYTWNEESINLRKFRKFSEAAFSPYYRFPTKNFNNFASFVPDEIDDFVFSSVERDTSHFIEDPSAKKAEDEKHKKDREATRPPKNTHQSATTPNPAGGKTTGKPKG